MNGGGYERLPSTEAEAIPSSHGLGFRTHGAIDLLIPKRPLNRPSAPVKREKKASAYGTRAVGAATG